MGRIVMVFVVIVVLAGLLATAAYAGYSGWGLVASGDPSARTGSIYGVYIMGGGPGTGK